MAVLSSCEIQTGVSTFPKIDRPIRSKHRRDSPGALTPQLKVEASIFGHQQYELVYYSL